MSERRAYKQFLLDTVLDALDNEALSMTQPWDAFDLCFAAWQNRHVYADAAEITVEEFEKTIIEEHPDLGPSLRAGRRL